MNYIFHLLIYLGIYLIVALSLNVVVGFCGRLTLAHAAYFAVGSYAYALASRVWGWEFVPSLALGVGLAVVLSLVVSLPTWRVKGDFFVMVSLAVQVLSFNVIYHWASPEASPGTWRNLTNGPFGLARVPKPAILGIKFDTLGSLSALSLGIAGCCLLLGWALFNSPWGRVLMALRDDELAARSLGKNVRLLKVEAFAVACGMMAVAGAIYASYVGYVDPSLASLDQSILMLCMVIVGGVGNFRGPLVGAAVLLAIPEVLRLVYLPDQTATEIRLMVYGLLLVAMMHFRPQGLAGSYRIE